MECITLYKSIATISRLFQHLGLSIGCDVLAVLWLARSIAPLHPSRGERRAIARLCLPSSCAPQELLAHSICHRVVVFLQAPLHHDPKVKVSNFQKCFFVERAKLSMAYIILYLLLFHIILALIAKVLPEANRGSMTEESTEPGSLIIACLCLVCVYFSFYKCDSCCVKISS